LKLRERLEWLSEELPRHINKDSWTPTGAKFWAEFMAGAASTAKDNELLEQQALTLKESNADLQKDLVETIGICKESFNNFNTVHDAWEISHATNNRLIETNNSLIEKIDRLIAGLAVAAKEKLELKAELDMYKKSKFKGHAGPGQDEPGRSIADWGNPYVA
jgi:hypothetical protein